MTEILTEKRLSIFHSNISSLRANYDNLHTLLSQMSITFDVISLTEVWNSKDSINNFNPNDLEGYYKYNGLPGTTLKSEQWILYKE